MFQQAVHRCVWSGYIFAMGAPLPEGKRVFQHGVFKSLLKSQVGEIQFGAFGLPIEPGQYFIPVFQDCLLKIQDFLSAFVGAHSIEKGIDAFVLCGQVQRCHIRHAHIHIIGVKVAVEDGGLSAFADAGADPFAVVKLAEQLTDVVQVGGGIFQVQVLPVGIFGDAGAKVAVFYVQLVGVKEPGEFVHSVAGALIALGGNDGWPVKAFVG